MAERGMPDISDELQSREKRVQVNEEKDGRENNLVNRLGFKVGLCLTSELSGLDTPNSQNFNLDQAHRTMDYLFVSSLQAFKAQGNNNTSQEKGPTQKRTK